MDHKLNEQVVKKIQQNNILYEVITSYEYQEWILSYHNILDF
jgi:hypothetical protein